MRTLSVNEDWPPFHQGGYAVGAWRLMQTLTDQYDVESYVVTSKYGSNSDFAKSESRISRSLPMPGRELVNGRWVHHHNKRMAREERKQATQIIIDTVESLKPDVVIFWQYLGDSSFSVDIINHLTSRKVPIFYYVSNMQLPLYRLVSMGDILRNASVPVWELTLRAARFWWRRLKEGWDWESACLDWRHVAFCSYYLKKRHIELGYPAQPGRVIHWGIDNIQNKPASQSRVVLGMPLKLVWAGRICQPKGLHVLIDALLSLPEEVAELDIYGIVEDDAYWQALLKKIQSQKRSHRIRFQGFITPSDLRVNFRNYDCFVFTSIWPEPFSVVLLEAMAEGLCIITTLTGGTGELAHHSNSSTYDSQSHNELAAKLGELHAHPNKVRALQLAALSTAREFSLEKMAVNLYDALLQAK